MHHWFRYFFSRNLALSSFCKARRLTTCFPLARMLKTQCPLTIKFPLFSAHISLQRICWPFCDKCNSLWNPRVEWKRRKSDIWSHYPLGSIRPEITVKGNIDLPRLIVFWLMVPVWALRFKFFFFPPTNLQLVNFWTSLLLISTLGRTGTLGMST